MIHKLDNTDRRILSILAVNAKAPYHEIAKKCKLSAGAVHKRVEKLEELGIIEGYKAQINSELIGYTTRAFVGVLLEKANKYISVKNSLGKIPEVVEAHFTTGHFGLLIKVYCRDNLHLKDILIEIHNIPGVASTETFISIEQPISQNISLRIAKE